MEQTYALIASPVDELLLCGRDGRLEKLWFMGAGTKHAPPTLDPTWRRDDSAFPEVQLQLNEYFTGRRREFDLELNMIGTTWERLVWDALLRIPYGETRSYGEIAVELGQPGAARAVGLANGRNPVSVIVPCHRVIGASGTLTGYGGGLERKRQLLDLEAGRLSLV
jgi:methylated-DNA-[protein]-cysteine S-methyltransferase